MSSRRITVVLVLVLLLILGLAAMPGGSAGAAATKYYLSLGDSLAAGWQPDPLTGTSDYTNQGYTDQLYRRLRDAVPGLRHQKLGCPGETTTSMIYGGGTHNCYPGSSQLNSAVAFLMAHPGEVAFITVNIGVNDVLSCLSDFSPYPDLETCVGAKLTGTVGPNLGTIVGTLRAYTAGAVPIVGMNYYNPYLAAWLEGIPPDGATGPQFAQLTNQLAMALNDMALEPVYAYFGVPVADVFAAYRSSRWQMVGGQPFNVMRICQYTWMCYGDPPLADIHTNRRGAGVIANTFQKVLDDEYGIG